MSASTEPTGDGELLRLLNFYTLDTLDIGAVVGTEGLRLRGDNAVRACKQMASRAALLAHIAAHYVRRERPPAIPPQEPEVGEFFDNVDLGIVQRWNGEQWVPTGRYKAARGVLPRRPGDELPEDAIRRLRDGAE